MRHVLGHTKGGEVSVIQDDICFGVLNPFLPSWDNGRRCEVR
jgi:hypothetical protein